MIIITSYIFRNRRAIYRNLLKQVFTRPTLQSWFWPLSLSALKFYNSKIYKICKQTHKAATSTHVIGLLQVQARRYFDVITSLVSLEHGVNSWEKVTSQRILALERSGVTSLLDISIVGMHVIRCHSNGTIWQLWVQRPRRCNIWINNIHTTTIIGE
jgi:hypothetical protein